ncbi:MAG: hypothetical protein CMC08_00060 [Flavobacteriaceae bacterium]|nr:hypothetical protein [Flavobacteriaceae bacterium]
MFETERDSEGRLSYPKPLSGVINTAFHESTPTFTKDGKTIYFTRNNFLDGKKGKDSDKTIRLKLYKATKGSEGMWSNVTELPFNSKEYSTAHPALSADETRLYFASDMPGTLGMSDLWYVEILSDGTYGNPVNLGPTINTEARESFPFVSQKNNLYFASDGHAGLGGFDLYVTPLDAMGMPGEASNLGEPANSNQDDFGFIINEDEYIGYMSSNREGNRGSIDDEIYRVQEKCEVTINGLVFDVDTKEPLPGANLMFLNASNEVIGTQVADDSGNFSFMAECELQYSIRATKDLYEPNEIVVRTPSKTGVIEVEIPLKRKDICDPRDLGCKLNLQPIYFDFDRYNIRPDAEVELAKILAAMREYDELVIHIESHTDSRGNDAYNEALSEKRAQSTLNWLVSKGIDRSRLSARGYGENRLVNECSNGVECTEEEHQLNRRSMFIIQN